MDFSVRLKKLLDAGNLKMKDLGLYLSYDLSYISKWVNGKCLPSTKTAEETLEKMAKFFAINLYQTDGQKVIKEISGRDVMIDRLARAEKLIQSILVDGYYYSLSKEEEIEFDSESLMRLNGRKDEIVSDISKELKKYIATSEEDMIMYFSIGKLRFFTDLIKEFNTFLWAKKHSVKLKFIISPDCYKQVVDSGIALLHLLIDTVIFLDMDLVVADISSDNGYIYVKNKGFFDLRFNTAGEAVSMIHSVNTELFKEYDAMVERQSYKERVIMKSKDVYGLDEDFNNYLSTNAPENYLLYASYFDGLVSEETMDKLIKENKISGLNKYLVEQDTLSGSVLLEMRKGVINLSKKGIFEAIRKKEVALGGINFILDEKTMDRYITNIIGIFDDMDEIDFNFINDDICPLKIYENNISIFATNDYLSIKKNPKYVDSKIHGYFEVLDKELTSKLYAAIEAQRDASYLEEVTKGKIINYLDYAKNSK